MKNYKYFIIIASVFTFTGCELFDETVDKANEEINRVGDQISDEYNRAVEQYEEYREDSDGDGKPDPKPFTVVFQTDPNDKSILLSAMCDANSKVRYFHYATPLDTNRVLQDIQGLDSYPGIQLPYWDIRYMDPISKFIDGGEHNQYADHSKFTGLDARSGDRNIAIGTSASQNDEAGAISVSECRNGLMTGGTNINLNNAPVQYIDYGGPQSTFIYQLANTALTNPWKNDGTGNLILQASFDKPLYINYEENNGGGVYFVLFLKNKRTGEAINYTVGLYAVGKAWIEEKRGIKFDTSTNIVHVSTIASDNSWWSTKSPTSKSLQVLEASSSNSKTLDDGKWNDFYRVNIAYQNLLAMLQELREKPPAGAESKDFGLNPEEWSISNAMIQYELEEKGGKALFSGSFTGFEVYVSSNPI